MFLLIKSVAIKLGTFQDFRISSLHFVTSLHVLDNWVLGFSSIRWMSLLLLATSESKSHVQYFDRKSSAVVEVNHTLSGV